MTVLNDGPTPLLFWYNQSDWSVYYCNATVGCIPAVYVSLPAGSVITSLTSHNRKTFFNGQLIHLYNT